MENNYRGSDANTAGANALIASAELLRLAPESLYIACAADALPDFDAVQAQYFNAPGQQRAVEAIEFGIGIQRGGYNIFVLGPNGTGRHLLVLERLQQRASSEATPADWCYVNNFFDSRCPRALSLPSGRGEQLREAMRRFVEELLAALPSAFERDEFRGRRETLEQQFKQKHEEAFGELGKKAEAKHIALVRTPVGVTLVPTRKGEPIRPDVFQRLPEAERTAIQASMDELQVELEHLLRQIPDWEREHRNAVRALIRETAAQSIDRLINEVRAAYRELPQVLDYLEDVETDIHEHIDDFLVVGRARAEQTSSAALEDDDGEFSLFRRYRVNVIVRHEKEHGAPVVYEDHPTYQRLVGRVEHIARQGTLHTDFNLIVPGALHRANGGYLILDAERLLTNSFSWDALKRALRSRQLRLESIEELLSLTSTTSLEPQAIPLQVTVVIIGSPYLYYLLAALDPDFNELFKIAAEFETDIERTRDSEAEFARLLFAVARRDGLRALEKSGAARIIEFSSRLAGNARRLSTDVSTALDLLQEADFCAARGNKNAIDAVDVQAAIDARTRRVDRLPKRLQDEIARKTLRIETAGSAVGQVNGLSVIALGTQFFGQPSRISAQVRLGRGEVLDIEREVKLGGPIHSKGVLILSGFLGGRFGRHCRLSLTASLVFEQSYGGVEGDSASAAELFALLSAIGDIPLRQTLAVTGSVDQHGKIQAIGGVNEKIEGFFDACRVRGLVPGQGVIIPAANADELMLRHDVVAAAQAGEFTIYAIDSVDEGMELLTGLEAGALDASGNYPVGTINQKIAAQLLAFSKIAAEQMDKGMDNKK